MRTSANMYRLSGDDYVAKIRDFPMSYFDMIVIDGSSRMSCFQICKPYLAPGGLLVIDDTDKDSHTQGEIFQIDQLLEYSRDYDVHRFPGWTRGCFFVKETTIAVLR